MNLFKNLWNKKKVNLADCESMRLDDENANKLLGGFKEYQPLFWELPNKTPSQIRPGDLLVDESTHYKTKST